MKTSLKIKQEGTSQRFRGNALKCICSFLKRFERLSESKRIRFYVYVLRESSVFSGSTENCVWETPRALNGQDGLRKCLCLFFIGAVFMAFLSLLIAKFEMISVVVTGKSGTDLPALSCRSKGSSGD